MFGSNNWSGGSAKNCELSATTDNAADVQQFNAAFDALWARAGGDSERDSRRDEDDGLDDEEADDNVSLEIASRAHPSRRKRVELRSSVIVH